MVMALGPPPAAQRPSVGVRGRLIIALAKKIASVWELLFSCRHGLIRSQMFAGWQGRFRAFS